MMLAALLGHEISLTAAGDVSRVVSLVRRLGPLPAWPSVPTKTLIDAMRSDKKTQAGKLRFVLTPRIGEAQSSDAVPIDAVESILRCAPRALDGTGKFHG